MADSMQPSGGQVIAPDGGVTYDFEGHISAEGIDLLAAQAGTSPGDRKIRWLREADGSLVAELVTSLNQNSPDRGGFLDLRAQDPDSGRRAGIRVLNDQTLTPEGRIILEFSNLPGVKTLLDSGRQSIFPQVTGPARQVFMETGNTPILGTGASIAQVTQPHGLGVLPRVVVASSLHFAFYAWTSNYTEDNFVIGVSQRDSAGFAGQINATWIAWSG